MTTPATSLPASAPRFHFMDNLRALAMLAGVLFHAALAYSPMLHAYWPTADASQSVWIDIFAWFSHLFRMPLFFVVAGFFVALMVQKRGMGGMLRHRFARLLLPFLVFWPLLYFAMRWLTIYAASHVDRPSPMLSLVAKWMLAPNAPSVPPSMMHLWFLLYLLCFCILVWVVITLEVRWPVFLKRRFAMLGSKSQLLVFVVCGPLLLVPAMAGVPAPIPAPEQFLPQWWALLIFGFYFLIGYQLFAQQWLIEAIRPLSPWLLVAAIVAYGLFLWLFKTPQFADVRWLRHLLQATLEAYAGLWMTLWCLSAGKRWLDHSHAGLRYVADASYWVYLVHLPILFCIQYYLLDVATGWPLKFSVSVVLTLAVAFFSYQFLVRNKLLGTWLSGATRRS